jgi:hypothetical protein
MSHACHQRMAACITVLAEFTPALMTGLPNRQSLQFPWRKSLTWIKRNFLCCLTGGSAAHTPGFAVLAEAGGRLRWSRRLELAAACRIRPSRIMKNARSLGVLRLDEGPIPRVHRCPRPNVGTPRQNIAHDRNICQQRAVSPLHAPRDLHAALALNYGGAGLQLQPEWRVVAALSVRRSATSAVIARLLFTTFVTRPEGTPRSRARRLALRLRAAISPEQPSRVDFSYAISLQTP